MPHDIMTFSEHFRELRKTLLVCVSILISVFIVMLFFRDLVFSCLMVPYKESLELLRFYKVLKQEKLPKLIAQGYQLPLISFFKATFYGSLFVSLPLIILNIWLFVEKGLYPSEKSRAALFSIVSILFFVAGVVLGFVFFLPYVLYFLVTYSFPESIEMVFSFTEYLDLVILLTVVVGIIFQIPVLMGFLASLDVVDWKTMLSFWKYFVVLSVIMAAVLTPPDVVSQILLAIPMSLLYIVGIAFAAVLGRR